MRPVPNSDADPERPGKPGPNNPPYLDQGSKTGVDNFGQHPFATYLNAALMHFTSVIASSRV
jgi:hypothetical protein